MSLKATERNMGAFGLVALLKLLPRVCFLVPMHLTKHFILARLKSAYQSKTLNRFIASLVGLQALLSLSMSMVNFVFVVLEPMALLSAFLRILPRSSMALNLVPFGRWTLSTN